MRTLIRCGNAPRPALLVVLDRTEVELDFGPPERLLESEAHARFVVGARNRSIARATSTLAPRETSKQIGEIDIVEGELPTAEGLSPVRRGAKFLAGRMPSELVIRGALLRILQRLVGLGKPP